MANQVRKETMTKSGKRCRDCSEISQYWSKIKLVSYWGWFTVKTDIHTPLYTHRPISWPTATAFLINYIQIIDLISHLQHLLKNFNNRSRNLFSVMSCETEQNVVLSLFSSALFLSQGLKRVQRKCLIIKGQCHPYYIMITTAVT